MFSRSKRYLLRPNYTSAPKVSGGAYTMSCPLSHPQPRVHYNSALFSSWRAPKSAHFPTKNLLILAVPASFKAIWDGGGSKHENVFLSGTTLVVFCILVLHKLLTLGITDSRRHGRDGFCGRALRRQHLVLRNAGAGDVNDTARAVQHPPCAEDGVRGSLPLCGPTGV